MAETTVPSKEYVKIDAEGDAPEVTVRFKGNDVITYEVMREDPSDPFGVSVGKGDNALFDSADTFSLKKPASELVGKWVLISTEHQSPDVNPVVRYEVQVSITQGSTHADGSPVIWKGMLDGSQKDTVDFVVNLT